MKSENLRNIPKISESKKKKVLFINAKRRDCQSIIPHNGLAILSGILKKRGHEVLIVDYQFIHDAPNISYFINRFKPDVIGMSVYTASFFEAERIISRVHKTNPNIPVIVGGPHATIYPDLLQKDKRIDYINVGEAELTIIDLVENAKKEKQGKIVQSKELVKLDDIPFPDYKSFYKWEYIRSYPIMTSRGCPFNCSFCIVSSFFKSLASKKSRKMYRRIRTR